MVLARSAALRASSLVRSVRPARPLRFAEQSWQRSFQQTARRTYASAHGAAGAAKTSDLPWALSATAATIGGLYIVLNQDFSHGEGHDEHHDEHHETEEPKEEEQQEEEPKAEESKDDGKDESKDDSKDDSEDKPAESKDEKKDEPKGEEKEDKKESAAPSESDKPHPSKKPTDSNETSGKQQGLSNDDTAHSTPVSENPDKSNKGEGVAETAKLKGSVDPSRPQA